MQALHDVVKAGFVRYIGMSSCWAWQCMQICLWLKWYPGPSNLSATVVHAMQSMPFINLSANMTYHVVPTQITPLQTSLLLLYLCRIIIALSTAKRNARCSPHWKFVKFCFYWYVYDWNSLLSAVRCRVHSMVSPRARSPYSPFGWSNQARDYRSVSRF
jgi:hypothetical protein